MHVGFGSDSTLLEFDIANTARHLEHSVHPRPPDAAPRDSTLAALDALSLALQLWFMVLRQRQCCSLAAQQSTTVADVCHGQLGAVPDDTDSRRAATGWRATTMSTGLV